MKPLVCVAALLLASPTWAQGVKQRARESYDRGAKLLEQGDYRGAVSAFEKSYMAVPHPNTLFNLAQCHEQLGDRDRAIEYYRRVEKDADNEVLRQKARDGLARLSADEPPAVPPVPAETPASTPAVAAPSAPSAQPQPTPAPNVAPESVKMPAAAEASTAEVPALAPGWRFSLAPGFLIPLGDVAETVGTGFDIAGRVGYALRFGQVGLEPEIAIEFARLGGKSQAFSDDMLGLYSAKFDHLGVFAAYGGGRGWIQLGRVIPFVAAHIGMYRYAYGELSIRGAGYGGQISCEEAADALGRDQGHCARSAVGFNVGPGIDVLIGRKIAVGLAIAYHLGFFETDDTSNFSALGISFSGTYLAN